MSDHLHTVVVGTAKSLNEDVYYKKSKNKFWKSLYESGITHEQIAPNEWRKIHSYGIGFMELTHKIHPTDATITKGELDIIKFIKNIENINNLKNIKDSGVTIIFISHKLDEVLDIADEISVISEPVIELAVPEF